jgi:hypothetical protein
MLTLSILHCRTSPKSLVGSPGSFVGVENDEGFLPPVCSQICLIGTRWERERVHAFVRVFWDSSPIQFLPRVSQKPTTVSNQGVDRKSIGEETMNPATFRLTVVRPTLGKMV